MTERHRDTLEYFVAPGPTSAPDGSLDRPFQTVGDALSAIGRSGELPIGEGVPGRRNLEIVCVDRPSATFRLRRRANFQFYFDTRAAGPGDGSEQRPWSSLNEALNGLIELHDNGKLDLRAGQLLRLVHREVFTATAVEKARRRKEQMAKYIFMAMALVCVIPVVATLGYLLFKAWPALSFDFVFTNPKNNLTAGGIWAPLIGTFFLVLTSLLVAAPIGVLAGVYLNEYARENWFTRIINLAVVNLAGVPSIVHALFGVGAFVHFAQMGKSLLAAACTVAVMTLPVIITSTKEALAAVPMPFRQACWNMGATRWQTIRTIVLPNSIAGILTGVILQVARAAGETAPILFTGAILYAPVADSGWDSIMPYRLGDRFMALSYHLFAQSTQIRGVSDEIMFGTAMVLIGLVLVVNSLSIVLRVFLRSRKKW